MKTWREIYELPEYKAATDEQKIDMVKSYIAASQRDRDEAIRSYRPMLANIGKTPEDIQKMVMEEIATTNALKYPGEEPELSVGESGITVEPKSHPGLAALNILANEEKLIGKQGTDRAMNLLGRNIGATVGAIGQQTPRGLLQSWQTDEEANALAEAAGARGENPYLAAAKGTIASRTGPLDVLLMGAPSAIKGAYGGIRKLPEAIGATKNLIGRARNISAGLEEAAKQYNPKWLQNIGKVKEAISDVPVGEYYERGKKLVGKMIDRAKKTTTAPEVMTTETGKALTKPEITPIIKKTEPEIPKTIGKLMKGKKVSTSTSKSYVKPEKVPGFQTLEDVSNIPEVDAAPKKLKSNVGKPKQIPSDYEEVDRGTINRRLTELSQRDRMAEVNSLFQPEEFNRKSALSREEIAERELQDETARRILESGELPFPRKTYSQSKTAKAQPKIVERTLGKDTKSIEKAAAADENFIDIVRSGDHKSLVDMGISPSLAKKIASGYGKDEKITEIVNNSIVKAYDIGKASANADRFEGILEDFGKTLGTGKRKGGMIGGE